MLQSVYMATFDAQTQEGKCIFCEIALGKMTTPGIWYEDDAFMAFLSIDPNTEGYSCVIPKDHYGSDVLSMPDAELQRFILAAKKAAAILENSFDDVGRVGLIMEGTGIDHAHIKLVPMHGTKVLRNGEWRQFISSEETWFDSYKGYISSAGGPRADDAALQLLAEKIRKSSETHNQE